MSDKKPPPDRPMPKPRDDGRRGNDGMPPGVRKDDKINPYQISETAKPPPRPKK